MKEKMVKSKWLVIIGLLIFAACTKKEAELPDNLVNFETTSQGIGESETSIQIKVKLSRIAEVAVPVTIQISDTGVVYGTDYTTVPAAAAGTVLLTIPAGSDQGLLTISKVPEALFDGDEKIGVKIVGAGSTVFVGQTASYKLTFSEIIADDGEAVIDGGGATYPNKVFVDLSANRQTAVRRSKWDLGFSMETNEFNVILNSSAGMMAKQLDKTNLADVSAADTVGFIVDLNFSQSAPSPLQLAYIDHPSGDLTKTAIAPIAANAADNKVYIINRGSAPGSPATARGWKKIKIARNSGGGYTVQHADIAATTFSEVSISKDASYFFRYISFEDGALTVEPEKTKWDIAWTYFSNTTITTGGEVPYLFQDIILQNRNVATAKVLESTKSFDSFGEADIAGLTFSTSQVAIGADWRSGGGPTTAPSIRNDRYYILKDGAGNYYKLRFTQLTQAGERGYPAYESVLIKKA